MTTWPVALHQSRHLEHVLATCTALETGTAACQSADRCQSSLLLLQCRWLASLPTAGQSTCTKHSIIAIVHFPHTDYDNADTLLICFQQAVRNNEVV